MVPACLLLITVILANIGYITNWTVFARIVKVSIALGVLGIILYYVKFEGRKKALYFAFGILIGVLVALEYFVE